jgi:predicted neutral ceramidase superfamily lipid hydrolase
MQQRTAATLVTLILSLCVLALLAMPLTWRRIALVVAAFVLLFPVRAVRTFYKLELPHGVISSTLLIAALGAAALAGFWALSSRQGPGAAQVAGIDLNRPT